MSKAAKSAIILFIATITSKSLGFVRDLIIASVYGAGTVSDSYIASLNIITVAFIGLFCVAIQSTFMPIFANIQENKNIDKAFDFTGNVINIIMVISIFASILGFVFTKPLVKLFAYGFQGDRLILTIQLTKILMFSIGVVAITYILKAYLELNDYFLITGIMPLPYNVSIIFSVLLSKKFGVSMLGYGTLFAFIIQMIFLVPFCLRSGFKYKFNFNIKDPNIKSMAISILPILIGASANQVNNLVDKNLASIFPDGAFSALNYGYKLNIFVTGLFVASITSVMYPMFSRLVANENIKKLKTSLATAINTVTLVTVPLSIGAIVLSQPIIRVLFERGQFTRENTILTANVLIFYSIGMLASGIRDVLVIAFYSLQDTKIPMKNSIICVGFNICFDLILINYFKAPGLAFATSISSIISVIFLMYSLKKKIGNLHAKSMLITFFKTAACGLVMAFVVYNVYNFLGEMKEIFALAISILIGAIVYSILAVLFKVDSVDYFVSIIKGKLKR
ncbi:MAG: murein biosynthesis integral membrane protein MurJ [Clostridioides sp.]|jgi:putative peptidoglycan lipid II flippase|nr:murein biosynthesis integral membrane protein MurJ [Clostridioides sp.]